MKSRSHGEAWRCPPCPVAGRWAESILHSLLSARHLIGAYFLTTEGDKRLRLLTRLYGTYVSCLTFLRFAGSLEDAWRPLFIISIDFQWARAKKPHAIKP